MTSSLLIPTVIENTGRAERAYDIYSMLLNNRIIFLGEAIDDRLANLVVAQLLYLNQKDPEQEISLYIHSPGGNVYAGLAIYDTIQAISNPVATWAVGLTASMATILLAAGTAGRRIALSHATIHMHPAGGGTKGYTSDVEIQYKELKRMDDLGHSILAKHTGQTVETIAADFERDRWMDAETAKAYGLVDKVSAQSVNGDATDED
ncbi:MAG: ATP-dependent Clp protease proteolytic subunit [Anaerolineae bacterium]|nr:ATP-dependent Clp protease proteolytic subunit [Anaerolineae bacterium]